MLKYTKNIGNMCISDLRNFQDVVHWRPFICGNDA
jgi:hypothetical protein